MPDVDFNGLYNDPQFQSLAPMEKRTLVKSLLQSTSDYQNLPRQEQLKAENLFTNQFPDFAPAPGMGDLKAAEYAAQPKPIPANFGNRQLLDRNVNQEYYDNQIQQRASEAGVPIGAGTTPRNKKGYVAVDPAAVDNTAMQFFNTDNPAANIPMKTAQALAVNGQDPVALQSFNKMSPVTQAAIIRQINVIQQQNADNANTEVLPDIEGGATLYNKKTGGITPGFVPSRDMPQILHGQEGGRQLQNDKGLLATIEKFGLSALDPENLALLGGAAVGGAGLDALIARAVPGLAEMGLGGRAVSGLFSGSMAKNAGEQFGSGDPYGGVLSLGLAGLAGAHAGGLDPIGALKNKAADWGIKFKNIINPPGTDISTDYVFQPGDQATGSLKAAIVTATKDLHPDLYADNPALQAKASELQSRVNGLKDGTDKRFTTSDQKMNELARINAEWNLFKSSMPVEAPVSPVEAPVPAETAKETVKPSEAVTEAPTVKNEVAPPVADAVPDAVASPKEPWQMTKSETLSTALQNRIDAHNAEPVIVVKKDGGEVVAEIKRGQIPNLNTDKFQALETGGRPLTTHDPKADDGWIGNVEQRHEAQVSQALAKGKPVPPEVLADYPALAAKYGTPDVPAPAPEASTQPTERGSGTLQAAVIPGAKEFVEQDIAPTVETLKNAGREIRDTFNPASATEQSKKAAMLVRKHTGELARKDAINQESFKKEVAMFNTKTDQHNLDFIHKIETGGMQKTKELSALAQKYRDALDSRRDEVQDLGKLQEYDPNYFPHNWNRSPDETGRVVGRAPLEGPKSFLKRRTIPTVKEGYNQGLKLVTTNPALLVQLKLHEMDRYIMAQNLWADLKENGLLKFVDAGIGGPEGYAMINDNLATVYGPRNEQGDIVTRGQYYAPTPVARILNNYLSPGMRGHSVYDTLMLMSNALNMAQLGLSGFHIMFTSIDSMISNNALALKRLLNGDVKGAFKQGAMAPLAPFTTIAKGHILRNAYLGKKVTYTVGKKTYTPAGNYPEIANYLAKAGGRISMDNYQYGLERGGLTTVRSRLMNALANKNYIGAALRLPFAVIELTSVPIMEHLVPRMKLGVFYDMASYELDRLSPDATEDQRNAAMQRALDSVDNRMGQLVYDNLFWDHTTKDTAHLLTRSVGWNLGSAREIGGAALDTATTPHRYKEYKADKNNAEPFTHRQAYILAGAITVGLIGAIMQYLYTGHGPESIRDLLHPRTGRKRPDGTDERVQVASYVKDVEGFIKDPLTLISHKTSPLINALGEIWNNKDYYGNRIHDPSDGVLEKRFQDAQHLLSQAIPFSWREVMKRQENGEKGFQKYQAMFGITQAPAELSRTDAENKIMEKVAGHMEVRGKTAEEANTYKKKQQLIQQMKNGQDISKSADEAMVNNELTPKDVKSVYRNASKQDDYFKSRLARLLPEEALDVYSVATPEEKKKWGSTIQNMVLKSGNVNLRNKAEVLGLFK